LLLIATAAAQHCSAVGSSDLEVLSVFPGRRIGGSVARPDMDTFVRFYKQLARPAFTRSWIIARWNSANTPSI